jgi:hypothetical protein
MNELPPVFTLFNLLKTMPKGNFRQLPWRESGIRDWGIKTNFLLSGVP